MTEDKRCSVQNNREYILSHIEIKQNWYLIVGTLWGTERQLYILSNSSTYTHTHTQKSFSSRRRHRKISVCSKHIFYHPQHDLCAESKQFYVKSYSPHTAEWNYRLFYNYFFTPLIWQWDWQSKSGSLDQIVQQLYLKVKVHWKVHSCHIKGEFNQNCWNWYICST